MSYPLWFCCVGDNYKAVRVAIWTQGHPSNVYQAIFKQYWLSVIKVAASLMFSGNVIQRGVSAVTTADHSNAACIRSCCLTKIIPVLCHFLKLVTPLEMPTSSLTCGRHIL